MKQFAALQRHCTHSIAKSTVAAGSLCTLTMGYIEAMSKIFPYDARIFTYDWDPVEAPTDAYLNGTLNPNSTALWEAIHVNGTTKEPKFEMSSGEVYAGLAKTIMTDVTP